ncbi:MAG: hypothetical protein NUW37_12600 [Planctomycetes bacterium]|nr:hypothetical protein [Planctomycetota bacterium]
MNRIAALGVAVTASLLLASCIEREEELKLNEDGSGTVAVWTHQQPNPMAEMIRQMMGGGAAAEPEWNDDAREVVAAGLPEGVELVDIGKQNIDGTDFDYVELNFDGILSLAEVAETDLQHPDASDPMAGGGMPGMPGMPGGGQGMPDVASSGLNNPWADVFIWVDEDGLWNYSREPLAGPAVPPEAQGQIPGGGGAQSLDQLPPPVRQQLESLRFVFRLILPNDPKSNNGDECKDNEVTWEFDFDRLTSLQQEEKKFFMRASWEGGEPTDTALTDAPEDTGDEEAPEAPVTPGEGEEAPEEGGY